MGYVLHHELTHLDHMDHSKRVWSSLKRILANVLDLRRELKEIDPEDIPLWATPPLNIWGLTLGQSVNQFANLASVPFWGIESLLVCHLCKRR